MASGYPIYMQMVLYAYITLSIMNGIIKCHGQKPSYRGRPYGCSIMKSGEKPGTGLVVVFMEKRIYFQIQSECKER